jgi:hypothetical protein
MRFNELYSKAMSPQGLSANFIGAQKKENVMKQKTLSFSIENASAVARTIALTLGGYPDFAALKAAYPAIDALLKEGVMLSHKEGEADVTDLKCEVTNNIRIANLQEYVKRNMARIKDLRLRTDNKENFLYEVEICVPNPFEILPTKALPLQQYVKDTAIDQNHLVATGINLPFNNDVLVLLHIKGDSQIDYSALMEYNDVNDQINLK